MKLELNGYNIDNLLKILYSKKVALFNVTRKSHDEVSFEIRDCDHKKVKRYIQNFKVRETLGAVKRFPKILLANIGVVLGCFVGVLFCIWASNYTWQIQIYGTKDLATTEILSVLESEGVKKGKINHQTSEEIENILLNHYDKIAQVSVIKKGTALIINLSEKLVYNPTTHEPIVATYSGIITHINIVTGTNNVKVGDYVQAGDVLVLPFNINSTGEKVSVKPLAEITAEIFVVNKREMKKTEQVLCRTGKSKKKYEYKFKNKKLFSSKFKNSFALFEVVVYNENISDLVPLNRDVLTYFELAPKEIVHDFEKEKENLMSICRREAQANLPAGKVLETNTKTEIVDNTLYAFTTIKILGQIHA